MTVALGNNIALPLSSALSYRLAFDTMGKLANYGKLGGTADPDAVIEALFASGEQGAWYDPSDLSTMYLDRAGTTQVTADGQPVGLILDKSKGLVLGSELASNGDFASGTSPWTSDAGITLSNVSSQLVQTASSGGWLKAWNRVSGVTSGKTYKIEIDVSGGSLTTSRYLNVGTNAGGYNIFQLAIANDFTGKITCYAVAQANYFDMGTECFFSIGNTVILDNFSIKELAGNHATAPSDAARPLKTSTTAADWINYDAVDDVLNSTFPSSLGSSCTVCRANVGAAPTILTAQTIGTSYADSTDHAGLIIVNRALTGQETTDVTAWLLAKGET